MKKTWRRITRSQSRSELQREDKTAATADPARTPANGFFFVGAEAGGLDAKRAVRQFLVPPRQTPRAVSVSPGVPGTGQGDGAVAVSRTPPSSGSHPPSGAATLPLPVAGPAASVPAASAPARSPRPTASLPIPLKDGHLALELNHQERLQEQIRHQCWNAEAAMYWRLASSGIAVPPPELDPDGDRSDWRARRACLAAARADDGTESDEAEGGGRPLHPDLPHLQGATRSSGGRGGQGGSPVSRRLSRKRSSQEMLFAMEGLDFGSSNSIASMHSPRDGPSNSAQDFPRT